VGPTAKLDVLGRRLAALRIRLDMVELDETGLLTAPSATGHEGTLTPVAGPDLSLHRGNFFRARSSRSVLSARFITSAVSPFGTTCRSMSLAWSNILQVSASAVNVTR
jgi:hypothetical protein